MITIGNHLGDINISKEFLVNLVGTVVTRCFGVAGMAASDAKQGIKEYLLQKSEGTDSSVDKGVRIRYITGKLYIDLHIIAVYGTNITAIVKSIIHKVRYTVDDVTGLDVYKVNVYVDGLKPE